MARQFLYLMYWGRLREKSISQEIARNIVHMGIRPGTEAEMNIPEIKVELEFK